jgi:hypothetical protein
MAKVVATKPRTANGGTAAPKSAAKSQTTGLGNNTAINPAHPNYVPRPAPKQPQTPPAAAPAPAPPKPYAAAPWDSAEQFSNANADTKYNNALLNAGYKKSAYETEYGLDPGYNDYKANPYSRAALLEQTYQRANRATGTSLGAAGQLYSGASQNAETYNREHNSQERNSLESAYRRALQGVTEEEAGALTTREDEKQAAKWKAIELAGNAELEPEASPAGNSGGGPGSAGPTKKVNKKPIAAKAFAKAIANAPKKKGK